MDDQASIRVSAVFYYVIPQAMRHATPQIHSAFYPHRSWVQSVESKRLRRTSVV